MKLQGKICVVTGGAKGIGRAMVERFVAEGAKVMAADFDATALAQLEAECDCAVFEADLSGEAGNRALIEATEQRFGPIDLFCANAGIAVGGGVEASEDEWQRSWQINVMAHVYAAKHVMPGMVGRGSGYFLVTASAAGLMNQIGSAPYGVTKHAAVGFAEWLAFTYADKGIKVSALCPQAVRTAMTASPDNPAVAAAAVDGMIEPEAVAEVVVAGLEKECFLILPHPDVAMYMQRKSGDYDRWIKGMNRLQGKLLEAGSES